MVLSNLVLFFIELVYFGGLQSRDNKINLIKDKDKFYTHSVGEAIYLLSSIPF